MTRPPDGASPFARLVQILGILRGEGGCSWDRQQDHHSLKHFLLEEAHEVLEAIDGEDPRHLREELGDLLMLVLFHSRIAEEAGDFDIDDVCRGIAEKMVRRHPHVFDRARQLQAEETLQQWELIKAGEPGRTQRTSLVDGIPGSLPALMRAQKVVARAADTGFRWPGPGDALAKVAEELDEVDRALLEEDAPAVEREVGDLLLAVVGLARTLGLDAESALRRATNRFSARFQRLEGRLPGALPGTAPDELLRVWQEVAD